MLSKFTQAAVSLFIPRCSGTVSARYDLSLRLVECNFCWNSAACRFDWLAMCLTESSESSSVITQNSTPWSLTSTGESKPIVTTPSSPRPSCGGDVITIGEAGGPNIRAPAVDGWTGDDTPAD